MRTAGLAVLAALLAGPAAAQTLRSGLYEVAVRLELPHLERYAVEQIRRVCVAANPAADAPPLPVLGANLPFADCAASALKHEGGRLDYDLVCPGRMAARARAAYRLTSDGFHGRIAMVMGAKNMTMTEVQSGRWLGACDTAALAD